MTSVNDVIRKCLKEKSLTIASSILLFLPQLTSIPFLSF